MPFPQKCLKGKPLKMRRGCFVVRIAGNNEYKALQDNPLNPFNLLDHEERIEEIIDLLSEIWAENCMEKVMR